MSNSQRLQGRAASVDRHELYELAVQEPSVEVEFVSSTFAELCGREALSIREDFCGTAVFSLAWVQTHPKRHAIGVDLDEATLRWGLERRIRAAGEDAASRVELRNANVLDPGGPQVDVTVAFNFSYWCFETRESLRDYFRLAYERLVDDGVLFLDAYGGTGVPVREVNAREVLDDEGVINEGRPFTYEWEQVDYNPITSHMECAIHFELEDGSRIEEAFTYSWRMWSPRELSELLHEAGFTRVRVWLEDEDEDEDGIGEYSEVEDYDNEGVWWVYLSAEKSKKG